MIVQRPHLVSSRAGRPHHCILASPLSRSKAVHLIRINASALPPCEHYLMMRDTQRFEASAGFGPGPLSPSRPLPFPESDFLRELGERLRALRSRRDMSRRELSRRSGISERYIAQIEAGKGNVSIVLLLRIAHAVRCD
jgi:DNA-binding XRE family transcriptional regulator